jgi:hypothetical protein
VDGILTVFTEGRSCAGNGMRSVRALGKYRSRTFLPTWASGRRPCTMVPMRRGLNNSATDAGRSNASVAYRSQRYARPAVEEEVAADHGEAAAAPDHAAKVIFNLLRRAGCDGDPDVVALPDFLPRPKRWRLRRGIAVIGPRHASGEDDGEYRCERFHRGAQLSSLMGRQTYGQRFIWHTQMAGTLGSLYFFPIEPSGIMQ